ncbi:MAG: ATP-binding protein, partial [bacterium]|nr:ATP-binding protein [bacterium]
RYIRETLEMTKPASPKYVFARLKEKVENTLQMMAGELDPQRFYVQMHFDADADFVKMDPDQIRQVLYNLLKNSIYEMPDGGIVTISGRRHEEEIHLDVRDYGRGVPPDVVDQIFEPFFTTKATGSGIGLSLSSQIMKNHGGRLDYVHHDGPGATFRLVFPIPNLGGEL